MPCMCSGSGEGGLGGGGGQGIRHSLIINPRLNSPVILHKLPLSHCFSPAEQAAVK